MIAFFFVSGILMAAMSILLLLILRRQQQMLAQLEMAMMLARWRREQLEAGQPQPDGLR